MFKGAKLDGATGAIALVFFCLEGLKYHSHIISHSFTTFFGPKKHLSLILYGAIVTWME